MFVVKGAKSYTSEEMASIVFQISLELRNDLQGKVLEMFCAEERRAIMAKGQAFLSTSLLAYLCAAHEAYIATHTSTPRQEIQSLHRAVNERFYFQVDSNYSELFNHNSSGWFVQMHSQFLICTLDHHENFGRANLRETPPGDALYYFNANFYDVGNGDMEVRFEKWMIFGEAEIYRSIFATLAGSIDWRA